MLHRLRGQLARGDFVTGSRASDLRLASLDCVAWVIRAAFARHVNSPPCRPHARQPVPLAATPQVELIVPCAITSPSRQAAPPESPAPPPGIPCLTGLPAPDRSFVHVQALWPAILAVLLLIAPGVASCAPGSRLWHRPREHGSRRQPARGFLPLRQRRLARAHRNPGRQVLLRHLHRAQRHHHRAVAGHPRRGGARASAHWRTTPTKRKPSACGSKASTSTPGTPRA